MSIETHEQYVAMQEQFAAIASNPETATSVDALAEISAALTAYEREVLGCQPTFQVDNEDTLSWYVGKIADLESKKKRIQAQADAMIADCQREIDGLQWRFGDQVEGVLRSLLTGRKKSVKFLTGTIGLRKTAGRVSFEGESYAALPAELHDKVVVEKVDSTALNRMVKVVDGKAYLTETGEELSVPGLIIKPESEKLYVKVGQEEDHG